MKNLNSKYDFSNLSTLKSKSIVYRLPKDKQYLHKKSDVIEILEAFNENICVPLAIDTEYTGDRRKGVTVQMVGVHESKGTIYDHKDLQEYARVNNKQLRHRPIKHDFAPLDHLERHGHKVELKVYPSVHKQDLYGNDLPFCQFDVNAHFALAEYLMMFTGKARESMLDLTLNGKSRIVEMTRRFRTFTKSPKTGMQISDAIELPFHLVLDGKTYRVKIRVIDTCALHGVASYKNLAKATGIQLEYKDSLTQYDLENMIETYFNKFEEFDNYALGDLAVYEILNNNAQLFRKVYRSLGIENYYKPPKLTIGSTVRDLFHAKLCDRLGIAPDDKEGKEKLAEHLSYGSSSTLKTETSTTKCLLAKVFGGRCRNNRPTDIYIDKKGDLKVKSKNHDLVQRIIADNDIAGAYGNGLRNQIYPIGRPTFEKFEVNNHRDVNHYLTLGEWLRKRKYGKAKCQLVNGLWTAVVSVPEGYKLKYAQDFLASWFDFKFKDLARMNTDSDSYDLEIKPKTGNSKIFNHEIVNAPINSDFVEWLYNICGKQQRKELLDNLYIQSACYYPAYSRVGSFDVLCDRFDNWQLKNTCISKKTKVVLDDGEVIFNGAVHMVNNEPTGWLGLDLGELIVDDLLAWRKMHQKLDGKKSPMDVLFKLCVNTLYGVFCSPYFDISNTVVGNNITARCRAMAWYMEKGHHAFQTITDGGQIDLMSVVFPASEKHKLTAHNIANLYRIKKLSDLKIKMGLIGQYNSIEIDYTNQADKIAKFKSEGKKYSFSDTIEFKTVKNGITEIIENPKEWLQVKLFEHLQDIFPNVSVLHQMTTNLVVEVGEDNTPVKSYVPQKGMFCFEIKDIYTKARFHGTSNYLLANEMESHVKMRSYEKKQHQAFSITENNNLVETEFYKNDNPSNFFLEQLGNPNSIYRSKVFKKKGILKLNDFRNNSEKWLEKGYVCGDTIEKVGLLREFSISQFTYHDQEQYKAIEREVNRNKRKYNQSYEGYFLNDDGTLDYQLMVLTIDKIIASGAHSINKELDRDRNRNRDLGVNHPEDKIYQLVKQQANRAIGIDLNLNMEEIDLSDSDSFYDDLDFDDDEYYS